MTWVTVLLKDLRFKLSIKLQTCLLDNVDIDRKKAIHVVLLCYGFPLGLTSFLWPMDVSHFMILTAYSASLSVIGRRRGLGGFLGFSRYDSSSL